MKNFLFIFFASLTFITFSQKKHTFNSVGSECYMEYLTFAPNNNYSSSNRTLFFTFGDPFLSLDEVFNSDTLKLVPEFYKYKFYYIANLDGNARNKLACLSSLVNLATIGLDNGNENIFLNINDSLITQKDIDENKLNKVFKKVKLNENKEKDSIQTENIYTEFKEVVAPPTNVEVENLGTFYIDEKIDADKPVAKPVIPKKTFFGNPTTFNYTLTGIIRDQNSSEALPFATIQIKGTSNLFTTNADGYFTILKVPSDTSVLIIHYIGYENQEVYLTPQMPKKNLVITLNPEAQSLSEVVVTGNKKEDVILANKTDVSTIKITPKKMEVLPNIGEKDVMRSFQLMPGVSASNESSSGLYVRGGTPDQNLVLYDGFTVYQVDHLYGFYSAFNANALKDVQLYKGGFESKFGGRLSSVTEITGKEGNQKKYNFGGDLSLLSVNIFAEIPIGKKFSSVIAFRRSYKGPIYDEIFKKFNQNQTNTSGFGGGGRRAQNTVVTSYFYDLNGKFTYKPNEKDIISLSVYNGTDKLDNTSSSNSSSFGGTTSNSNFSYSSIDLTKYGNFGTSLRWSRKWGDKLYGNTLLSYSNYYSDRNKSQQNSRTDSTGVTKTTASGIYENNDLKDYSLKTDYQWDILKNSQLQFGGNATFYDIKYTYAQNDTTTVLDRKNTAFLFTGYLQTKTKLFKNRLQILPGIRYNYFETTKQMYYEPRLSFTLNLTKRITLKGATGKYYQFTNRVTREDILSGSKDFWLLSDGKSVPVSSAIHYIAGISHESTNYLFSVEGYYKNLSNLTEYSLRFNPTPMGINYNENFFHGYGFSRGLEFLAQKKSGKFNGWVSYTLGQARSHFDIYSSDYYPSNQDVTKEFKVVGLYKIKRWDFAITWIYATGRPYTAPSGAYSVTLLDGSTQDFFTVTSKNELRLPDYKRMDVSINYKILAGAKGEKKRREIGYIGLSIFNVLNQQNVWYKQFTISKGSILETNVNYLGITPNLTLSMKLR